MVLNVALPWYRWTWNGYRSTPFIFFIALGLAMTMPAWCQDAGQNAGAAATGGGAAPDAPADAPSSDAPDSERAETDAGDDVEDSSPEALVAYSKAANLQNNGQFDLASESWQTFLKDFEKDPKALEARYNLGVCLLQQKQYEPAREQLRQVIDTGREFERRPDAFLNLGWASYSQAIAVKNDPTLFTEAADAFGKLLETYPESGYADQALFFRGESLYLQGKRPEAAEVYQKLIQDFPDSKLRADGLYALGVTFEELGRFADAGTTYDQLLTGFPDSKLKDEVRMRKAETLMQTNQLVEAEKLFGEVAQTADFASSDHALYRQATCVARQERFEEAGTLFASLPTRFPQSRYLHEAKMASGRAYFRAEKTEEAARAFDETLANATSPHRAEAAHWRARLYLKSQQAKEAAELIDKQLETAEIDKSPFYVNLLLDQADALHEIPERKAETVDLYAKLAEQFPQHAVAPQALYNAAYGALETKDYPRGVELANRFIENYPTNRLIPDVKHVAAECQLQLGDTAAAANTFSELTKEGEGREEAGQWQLRQAVALYAEKKYADVVSALETHGKALKTPDEQAEAFYLMGMSQIALQQWDAANASLSKSMEAQPRWRQADETLLNLARLRRRLKDLPGATSTVERLIRDFPDSTLLDQAHYRLGEFQYAAGKFPESITSYQLVLKNWPQTSITPYVLYGLGWAQIKATQLPAAIESFTRLLDTYPTHSLVTQSLYARALARQQSGQFDAAITDVAAFTAKNPARRELSDGRYVEAICLVGKKDYAAAAKVLQQIVTQDPSYPNLDKVLYELAWAQKTLKDDTAAIAAFKLLTDKQPTSSLAAEAFYHQAESEYDGGRFAEAIRAYEQARDRIQASNPDLGEKVLYKLGWSQYQAADYATAQATFARQAADYPQGSLRGDAFFMQGECLFKQEKHEDALAMYRQASQLPLSSEQITTLTYLHAGQAAGQKNEWRESYQWLAALAQKYPQSPYLMQIAYELAVAQQNLGNAAEATRLFGSVADRSSGELAARARFMLGEVHYAKKDYTQAIREFRKLMFEFDNKAGDAVKRWQAKAGFEAGQCAGVLASQQANRRERQQYIELATKFFQYVQTQHPQSEEATASAEQLKKLGQ